MKTILRKHAMNRIENLSKEKLVKHEAGKDVEAKESKSLEKKEKMAGLDKYLKDLTR